MNTNESIKEAIQQVVVQFATVMVGTDDEPVSRLQACCSCRRSFSMGFPSLHIIRYKTLYQEKRTRNPSLTSVLDQFIPIHQQFDEYWLQNTIAVPIPHVTEIRQSSGFFDDKKAIETLNNTFLDDNDVTSCDVVSCNEDEIEVHKYLSWSDWKAV